MNNNLIDKIPLHAGLDANSDFDFLYACCPACTYRLSQSCIGTRSRQTCPECKALLGITVTDDSVIVRLLEKPKRAPTQRRQTVPALAQER